MSLDEAQERTRRYAIGLEDSHILFPEVPEDGKTPKWEILFHYRKINDQVRSHEAWQKEILKRQRQKLLDMGIPKEEIVY